MDVVPLFALSALVTTDALQTVIFALPTVWFPIVLVVFCVNVKSFFAGSAVLCPCWVACFAIYALSTFIILQTMFRGVLALSAFCVILFAFQTIWVTRFALWGSFKNQPKVRFTFETTVDITSNTMIFACLALVS